MMLGQIVWREGGAPLEIVEVKGLRILRGGLSPGGRFSRWRLGRLLRIFRGQGVVRLLVPVDFDGWAQVRRWGFSKVDYIPFLRRNGAALLLLAMRGQGMCPETCCVALRGSRGGRDMEAVAMALIPHVRDIAISAPVGGASIQSRLRKQWGLGVAPDGDEMDGVLCFDGGGRAEGRVVLTLFGDSPVLGGLEINVEKLPAFLETEPLALLAALWEAEKIDGNDLEFYLTS